MLRSPPSPNGGLELKYQVLRSGVGESSTPIYGGGEPDLGLPQLPYGKHQEGKPFSPL